MQHVGLNLKLRRLTAALLDWFSQNARDLPWRRTHDPYAVWVSEIMLQQTQVKTVIPYWERWVRELPTIQTLADAPPATIHKLWEGLGYYTRVRNMQKAAQEIVTRHEGVFPRAHAAILELPGIGRYTAGAISSIAFNEPYPILDGNVIRVLTRVFGIAENPREKLTNQKLWKLAEQLVDAAISVSDPLTPTGGEGRGEGEGHDSKRGHKESGIHCYSQLNQSLMELGALICTPRQPSCNLCPLQPDCIAFRTGRVGQLPNLAPRVIATQRRFIAFVTERRGRFLVRQRPAGQVNAHLWEFPNLEVNDLQPDLPKLAREVLGFKAAAFEEFCTIKHSITRYRITLQVFRATGSPGAKSSMGWLAPDELTKLAFTSAHLKILKLILKK